MLIANPIYDVVFHYLMEDIEVAKQLIGHIIDQQIIHLEPNPTVVPHKTATRYHVYRMDYAATIKTDKDEEYKVIIEIQKASIIDDILRFRTYLAKQYSAYIKREVRDKRATHQTRYRKDKKKLTLPIISIYFLGDKLEHLEDAFIKVQRHYYNGITDEKINTKENFIEQLTHDSYIIQIPYLSQQSRTELEEILSIFNQHYILDTKHAHTLNFPDHATSPALKLMIKRLLQAQLNEEMEAIMLLEDEQLDKAAELEQALLDKEKERMAKEKERIAKETALQENERLIEILKKQGIDY